LIASPLAGLHARIAAGSCSNSHREIRPSGHVKVEVQITQSTGLPITRFFLCLLWKKN
jgi:hypothetical protein